MLEIVWCKLGMPKYTDPRLIAAENRAFLRELAATGNVREAARRVGKAYGTMQHRRKRSIPFAQKWDAAVVLAQARLGVRGDFRPERGRGGRAFPGASAPGPSTTAPRGAAVPLPEQARGGSREGYRTLGGEGVVVRRNDGRLQYRRAQVGKLTRACEQAFLLALSATCNVKLAAAAAGAAEKAFYRRKRRDKGFAREWGQALQEGYARLELACMEAALPEGHEHNGWAHNEPPAMPPMTPNQALQLLYLHQKEARLQAEPAHLKKRRGESAEAHSYRLGEMWEAGREREREKFRIAEAVRHARGEDTYFPWEPPVGLPDLAQVTGWSRARDKTHEADRALFGGWRIEDMKGKGQ